jgi:hypothetical protein
LQMWKMLFRFILLVRPPLCAYSMERAQSEMEHLCKRKPGA